MSDVAVGWVSAKLANIGRWSSGGTPSRLTKEYFGDGIPWVKSGDLPDGPIKKTEEQITEFGLKNSSAKLMPSGTILIALYGATIGKLGVLTFPAATNQACANVIPDTKVVDPMYLFFYLMSEKKNLIEKGQGGAQPNISQEILKEHPIPLAPLNEQRNIVAKLEKLLSRVDVAQARLAKIPLLLKRFRQSVLAAACSGRLTADWRQQNSTTESGDLLAGRIVLENKELSKKFNITSYAETNADSEYNTERFPLPDSWTWISSGAIFYYVTSGSRGWAKYYVDEGPIFIRIGNLDHDTIELDFRNVQHVRPPRRAEGNRTRVMQGDVLISITANVGMVGLVRSDPGESYINQHVALARPVNCIDKRYIAYFLASPNGGQEQLSSLQRGMTKTGLGLDDIRSVSVALPPFKEQQEIVRRVEELLKTADALEARYQKAKAHVDNLTQSILARAFRGELVPQDPNDEPASVLLEKIRRDSSALEVGSKKRTRLRV